MTAKINRQRVLLLYIDLTFKWGGAKYYSYNILTPLPSPTHPQHMNKYSWERELDGIWILNYLITHINNSMTCSNRQL